MLHTVHHAHHITEIASPQIAFVNGVTQFHDTDLSWSNDTVLFDSPALSRADHTLTSESPAISIAHNTDVIASRGPRTLVLSQWNISDSVIAVGFELLLRVSRQARIQDRRIQFTVQGHAVGQNLAAATAADSHVYGSSVSLSGITAAQLRDPTLTLLIDLQPHSQYPHSTMVHVHAAVLRVYTA